MVTNRTVKQLIIDLFGATYISATYTWEKFCSHLFHGRQFSQIKIDVVFQILHYALNGGNEPTPLHILVAEGVYS